MGYKVRPQLSQAARLCCNANNASPCPAFKYTFHAPYLLTLSIVPQNVAKVYVPVDNAICMYAATFLV